MIAIDIPGADALRLEHLVLDYNGTLAEDGQPIEGTAARVEALAEALTVHVITADTHGTVAERLAGWPCRVEILPAGAQDVAKADFVRRLGAGACCAMGNGRNDGLMLKTAALGVGLLQAEGAAVASVMAADVLISSIIDALDLLLLPDRLRATLRC